MAAVSSKVKKAEGIKKRKRKRGAADSGDLETEIIKLLKAQQEVIMKAEEKDQKVMEAMLKFHRESEQGRQQLLVSVPGKICNILAK